MATAHHAQYVVLVGDEINEALVGHPGCRYVSPPQAPSPARDLIATLLGRPVAEITGTGPWHVAIAGGRRTVTLQPGDYAGHLQSEGSDDG